MADVKVSALSEATQSELTDATLALASVVDTNSSTGFSSRKSTFAKLATYVLNTFTIALGGTVRTMKAAYDALYNVVSNHSSTLGSTSISSIGDGTVTGAISSLNNDLTKLFVKDIGFASVTFDAGGYKNIASSFPTTPTGYRFCFALLWSYNTVSSHDAVAVSAAGNYLLGTGGATVTNVVIRYVFCNHLEN